MDPLSRYRDEQAYDVAAADGAVHTVVGARWLDDRPRDVTWHTIAAGESFETLAVRFYGSSALWWRIADVNPAGFALALVPGSVVAVPAGGAGSGPVRTRSW